MKSIQESKLSMYFVVNDYLTTNATFTTPLPNYAGFFTTFKNSISSIQTYAEQQNFDKKGIALSKSQLKNTLVMLVADNSRRLTAMAMYVNNQILLKEIKYNESELKRKSDTSLRDIAQGVYDRAQTNLTALANYGVTAATQTALQTAINSFVASIPKPRLGIADKKQSTMQLTNFFKIADLALDNIDTLVEIVKNSQPVFYSGYKMSRKLIKTGTGTLAVKGLITDAVSKQPIKGVYVSFTLDGAAGILKSTKAADTIIKKTADKGRFNIKNLQAGLYIVTIKKTGYAEQTKTIVVSDGELTELNVQLYKN